MTMQPHHAASPRPAPRRASNFALWGLVLVVLVAGCLAVGIALNSHTRVVSESTSTHRGPTVEPESLPAAGNQRISTVARPIPSPRSRRPLQEFDYGWFTVGYDNERGAGAWGRYDLDGPIVHTQSQPKRPAFRAEPRCNNRVTTKDYSNPNNLFERGHIVPSFAMWSRYGEDARKATFVMTNVFPQDEDLNGRLWEDLEDDIAGQVRGGQVADHGFGGRLRNITVFSGPVYSTAARKLPSGIPIPDACFSIIYDLDETTGSYRARAYLIPNQAGLAGPLHRYAHTIRSIEEATGLDFMPEWGSEAETIEVLPADSQAW